MTDVTTIALRRLCAGEARRERRETERRLVSEKPEIKRYVPFRLVVTAPRACRPGPSIWIRPEWAWEDLNLRPLPYQGSALTD